MRYLILGASAAGISCAKTIRELDDKGEITVISQDDKIYSRCMLHHIIGEHKTIEALNFAGDAFFEEYNINWIKGKKVKKLNIEDKKVSLEDGSLVGYDKLFIGTGASSFLPPITNLKEGKNVFGLRNVEDALKIKEVCRNVKNVAILGAGLVGIDAAMGLLDKNLNISIIEMNDRILPVQLDYEASLSYEKLFKEKNINIIKNSKVVRIELDENHSVKGLYLEDNRFLECEMIVVAVGVRPNIDFIEENTLNINKGIVINNKGETNIKDIYAGGDVTANTPIWPIAVKQGITAGYNMANKEKIMEDVFVFRNSMNFLGLETVSLGYINPLDDTFEVEVKKEGCSYTKIIHKEGIIYGAIIQGDISYCGVLSHIIKNKISISHINKKILDINYADFFKVKENGEYEFAIS